MNQPPSPSFLQFVRALDYPYYLGSIFPSEMAHFLSQCDQAAVKTIIESGRQDGYSTAVLGAYGDAQHINVFSIDFEQDAARAQVCRERLARFKSLHLLKGSATDKMREALAQAEPPIALLIDGPKGHLAVYLAAASAAYAGVGLVAQHNTESSVPWHSQFVARFGEARFFEDTALYHDPDLPQFREWENQVSQGTIGRSIERTSLAVARLPKPGPDTAYLRGTTFWHTFNALSLYWSWRLGTPALVPSVWWQDTRRRLSRSA